MRDSKQTESNHSLPYEGFFGGNLTVNSKAIIDSFNVIGFAGGNYVQPKSLNTGGGVNSAQIGEIKK